MKPDWSSIDPKRLADKLRAMLSKGLTHADNFDCAIVELPFKHGAETPVENPLRSVPLAFEPLEAWDPTTRRPLSVLGTPRFNRTPRADGKLGITVEYDLRHTLPRLRLLANGQLIANAAAVPVSWPTVSTADPYGIITVASNGTGPTNTRVRFGEAGVYAYTGNIGFNNSAAGTRYIESGIDQNGTLTMYNRPTEDARLPLAAGGTYTNIAGQVVVAAGSYLEIYAFQDSGAALNLTSNSLTNLSVVRICNDSRPTGIVRGVLWGG